MVLDEELYTPCLTQYDEHADYPSPDMQSPSFTEHNDRGEFPELRQAFRHVHVLLICNHPPFSSPEDFDLRDDFIFDLA